MLKYHLYHLLNKCLAIKCIFWHFACSCWKLRCYISFRRIVCLKDQLMGLCIFADKTKINLSLRLPRRKTGYMLEEFFIIREKIYLKKLQYDLFAIPRINQLHFPIYKKIMMFFNFIFFLGWQLYCYFTLFAFLPAFIRQDLFI